MIAEIYRLRLLELACRIEFHQELNLPDLYLPHWFMSEEGCEDGEREECGFPGIRRHFKRNKHWCGTSACVAGHGAIMIHERDKAVSLNESTVAEWFGLTGMQTRLLFREGPLRATDEQAAKVIRNLVATGEVDWRFAKAEKV